MRDDKGDVGTTGDGTRCEEVDYGSAGVEEEFVGGSWEKGDGHGRLVSISHARSGGMHHDYGVAAIEFIENRVEGFVTEVRSVGVGHEDHAVTVEVVEGVCDLVEAALDIW